MKLYDFSIYAKRRNERKAAEAVAGVVAHIEQPGSVIELKSKVNTWFALHREVLKLRAS
jgi:hypothetical protein